MSFSGKIVNNNYIIREKLFEEIYYSVWESQSIYSVNKFIILFLNSFQNKILENAKKTLEKYSYKTFTYSTKIFETNEYENIFFIACELENGMTLPEYISEKEKLSFSELLKITTGICRGLAELEEKQELLRYISENNIWLTFMGNEIKSIKIINFGLDEIKNIINLKVPVFNKNYMSLLSKTIKKILHYPEKSHDDLKKIFQGYKSDKLYKDDYMPVFEKIINSKYKNASDVLSDIIIPDKNNTGAEKNILGGYQNDRASFFNKDKTTEFGEKEVTSEDRINYFNKMNVDRKDFYGKTDMNELNIYFSKLEKERNYYYKSISEKKKIYIDTLVDETKKYLINIKNNKTSENKTHGIIRYYQKVSEATKELVDFVSENRNEWTKKLNNETSNNEELTKDKIEKKHNFLNSFIFNIDRYTENIALDTKKYFTNLTTETKKFTNGQNEFLSVYSREYKKNTAGVINDILKRTEDYFKKLEKDHIESNNKTNDIKAPYKKTEKPDLKKAELDFLKLLFNKKNDFRFIIKLYNNAKKGKGNLCFIKSAYNASSNIIEKIIPVLNTTDNTYINRADAKNTHSVFKKILIDFYENKKSILDKINKNEADILSELFLSIGKKNNPAIIILQNAEYLDRLTEKTLAVLAGKITNHPALIIAFYDKLFITLKNQE